MDTKSIRRANVALLAKEVGSVTALAQLGNTSQSYLSQIIGPTPRRHVGDDLARRLEYVCRKPANWLDVLHVDDEKVAKARSFYEILLQLPTEKIDALITLFDLNVQPGAMGRVDLEAVPKRKTGPRATKK